VGDLPLEYDVLPHGILLKNEVSVKNTTIGDIRFIGPVIIGKDSYIGNCCIIGYPDRTHLLKGEIKVTKIGKKSVIRPFSIIYEDVTIGDQFETGSHVQIREGSRIGNQVRVGTHSILERDVKIGNRVRIHSNNFISEYTVIGDDVWISPCVSILNDKYPVTDKLIGPRIEQGAIIGANTIIFPGLLIGRNAVVAAGSLVTKDAPPESLVVGSPAKPYLTRAAYNQKQRSWVEESIRRR